MFMIKNVLEFRLAFEQLRSRIQEEDLLRMIERLMSRIGEIERKVLQINEGKGDGTPILTPDHKGEGPLFKEIKARLKDQEIYQLICDLESYCNGLLNLND